MARAWPQVSGADDNHIVYSVQSEYFSDFFVKIAYIISISLLPEAAEIIQILTDL